MNGPQQHILFAGSRRLRRRVRLLGGDTARSGAVVLSWRGRVGVLAVAAFLLGVGPALALDLKDHPKANLTTASRSTCSLDPNLTFTRSLTPQRWQFSRDPGGYYPPCPIDSDWLQVSSVYPDALTVPVATSSFIAAFEYRLDPASVRGVVPSYYTGTTPVIYAAGSFGTQKIYQSGSTYVVQGGSYQSGSIPLSSVSREIKARACVVVVGQRRASGGYDVTKVGAIRYDTTNGSFIYSVDRTQLSNESLSTLRPLTMGGGAIVQGGGRLLTKVAPRLGPVVEKTGRAITSGGTRVAKPTKAAVKEGKIIAKSRKARVAFRAAGGSVSSLIAAAATDQDLTDAALAGATVPVLGHILKFGAGRPMTF